MKKILLSIKTGHLFCFGLIVLALSLVPTLILGTDSIVTYHDQLDGELIAYIYQAKYMFSGQNVIPEFLNGVGKTALTPPAPLATFLFSLLPPFAAYSILQFGAQLIAYVGMFLLSNRITGHRYISFIVAILYTFLPFLPVYGLAQYGIPLLLLCFWNLYQRKYMVISYVYIGIYAGMSSLVLIGFAWIIIGGILLVYSLVTKRVKKTVHVLLSILLMCGIYVLENLSLISQILGVNEGFVSHKTEYVLSASSFITQFWNYLTSDTEHATDHHFWIIPIVLGTLLFTILTNKQLSDVQKKFRKFLLFDVLTICILCCLAAFWMTPFAVSIRERFGALGAVNFSRVLWITPTLWYLALVFCLTILWSGQNFMKWVQYAFSFVFLGILAVCCLKNSFVKPNIQKLLNPQSPSISWSDYLALGVMNQVEDYLYEEEGLRMEEYKVASLGIDPAAALYHGFYCVDGYSNNYPLSYKHAFREVIAAEVEKSDWLKTYFDNWGNRCYLFSSEIPGYYNIEKGSFWYNNLQLNTSALKELGCDYILSAAYIVNAEELNLSLLSEEAFETPESYYRIYVYKIQAQ